MVIEAPGDCSPSRIVVSKINTRCFSELALTAVLSEVAVVI
jgi:hypothetical protein